MSRSSRRTFLTHAAALAAASSCSAPVKSSLGALPRSQEKLDRETFIADVERARAEGGQPAVHDVLARTVADPRSVILGLGEPSEAGIHTLHRAPNLTILNVIWSPLMILLPHDHRMWATIGIYGGREDNILWQRNGSLVEANGAASLSEKEVFSLPDDAVHSVTNPIERLTGAIHVYGGDFFAEGRSEWDAETLRQRPFDLERARRTFEEAKRRFEAGR
jgi:predicted metal-dependent enzyme (double-stranded beta helix superfamily)